MMISVSVAKMRECEARAKRLGERLAVVVMDAGDDREVLIVRESYVGSAEFEAFDGEVLYVSGE